jgi:DNA polymerase-3 subunit gamma/tau
MALGASAEMVLIRLAFTADLPPPDEIIKALGGGAAARSQTPAAGRAPALAPAGPVAQMPAPSMTPSRPHAVPAATPPPGPPPMDHIPEYVLPDHLAAAHMEAPPDGQDLLGEEESGLEVHSETALPSPQSFAEVVALAGTKRAAKLKYDLEERVSLVKFDPGGSIDLHLLPGAPKELPNELRERLNLWTGMRWVVALSNRPGERPLGEVQREREAAELQEIRSHPAVAAVLQEFPEAKVRLKPLPGSKG